MTGKVRTLVEILGSRVLVVVLGALTDVALARFMSVADRGVFSALQGTVLLLAGIITFGLEFGFMLGSRVPRLADLLRLYRKVLGPLSLLGVAAAVGLSLRYGLTGPQAAGVTLITVAEIVTILLLPVILQYRDSARFGLVRILRRGLLLLGLVVIWALARPEPLGVGAAIWLNAVAWGAVALLALRLAAPSGEDRDDGEVPPLRALWRAGSGVFLAKHTERSQTRVGLVVLGILGFGEQAAYFAVSALAMDLAIFVSGSLSIALLTRRGDQDLVGRRDFVLLILGILALNAVGALVIWFAAGPVIGLIYGERYLPVVRLVRIFLPAIVLYGAYPLFSTYLLRLKRTRLVVGGNVFALAANVIATALLIPAHGAVGAAIALVGALLLNVLVVGVGATRGR